MDNTALIFGAGKTGRGFAAHLAFLGGYRIILIDKSKQLIADLRAAKQYDVQVLDAHEKSSTILLSGAYHIEDPAWHREFVTTHLVFTAVFGNNLEDLSAHLAKAFHKRRKRNAQQFLTVITCENLAGAASVLKQGMLKHLRPANQAWLSQVVGFSESIVFRTCLDAGENQPGLTIRTHNFFELPCNGDEVKEVLHVVGLKPLKNFDNQLRRKIYTYNCINAVIAYLGSKKGYTQLHEAGNDPEIIISARKAANESSRAQVAEFGFDEKEQEEWVAAAFKKFSDTNMPDPIERNAADPVRKLQRDDRLIGPALLAIKHGISPEGLVTGIMACLDYPDPKTDQKIIDLIKERGHDAVLKEVCGLSPEEELYALIKKQLEQQNNRYGKS